MQLIEDAEGLECFGLLGVVVGKLESCSEELEQLVSDKFACLVPHLKSGGRLGSLRLRAVEVLAKCNDRFELSALFLETELVDVLLGMYARFPLVDPLLRAVQQILLSCVDLDNFERLMHTLFSTKFMDTILGAPLVHSQQIGSQLVVLEDNADVNEYLTEMVPGWNAYKERLKAYQLRAQGHLVEDPRVAKHSDFIEESRPRNSQEIVQMLVDDNEGLDFGD